MAKKATSSGSGKTRKKASKKSKASAGGASASRAKKARKSSKSAPGRNGKSRTTKQAKSPLSKSELKEFRELLLDKRRDIIGDMNGMEAGALGPDRPESGGDITDQGSDNFEQEFTLGLLESERSLLAEINEALQRIDEGTYGICQGTGKPISKARLTARPWTPYGIEYARMVEKGLVRAGDPLPPDDEDDWED